MTFFLIAFPAACFGAMIGLLALGLCRAAAEDGSPSASGDSPPRSSLADLQQLAPSRAQEGTKGRPGRTRTASRPSFDGRSSEQGRTHVHRGPLDGTAATCHPVAARVPRLDDYRPLLDRIQESEARARLYPTGDVQGVRRDWPADAA